MMHRDDNDPKREFSEEFLNAFVDNQLTLEEKDRAYLRVSQDEPLSRQVCELRKLQDMIRFSYQNPPPAPVHPLPADRYGRLGLGIAAGIALAVGVALGWVLHNPAPRQAPEALAVPPAKVALPAPHTAPRTATTRTHVAAVVAPEAARTATPAVMADEDGPVLPYKPRHVSGDTAKVLFHVSQASAARDPQTLDEIENLVRYYREKHQSARVEVVINGGGLDLVRMGITRFADRIRQMQQDYDNLTFAACQNTIDQLKREHGVSARLLPGVTVIDSGVAQIMRRQQQGWAYIRS